MSESDERDMRPVTVPFWVLDDAMPALLGALEVYTQMRAAKIETALRIDLIRFEVAIGVIAEAMEVVDPGVFYSPVGKDKGETP